MDTTPLADALGDDLAVHDAAAHDPTEHDPAVRDSTHDVRPGSLAASVAAPAVGLGEATHGSREFVAVRARLTHELCARGHRAVALEAGAGSVLALDRYVAHGEGTLADALTALPEFWQTERFADFCRRLRAANRRRREAGGAPVRLYGVDVDDPGVLADAIRRECRSLAAEPTAASDEHRDVPTVLDTLADDPGSLAGRVPDERVDRADRAATATREWLDTHDSTDTRLAFLVNTLAQTVEWLRTGGATGDFEPAAMADRDRVMASGVTTLADHGVVLWAHAVHVQRGTFDNGTAWSDQPTAGGRLADRLGDDYRVVGTDFAVGGFRAGTPESDGLVPCRVERPVETSVAARLRGRAPCVFDPRNAENPPDCVRGVGLAFDADDEPQLVTTDLATAFDRVIAFETVSPTVPFESD